jgi:hypothetical protein
MAKLKSGTRIYGTATIDTSVVVGSAVTLSSSGIQVTGISTLNNANATQLTVSGVSTFSGIATHTTSLFGTQASFTGIVTATSFSGNASLTQLNVTGVSTLGVTSATNLTAQQLNVSGLSTFAGITTHTASLFGTQASFTGIVTSAQLDLTASATANDSVLYLSGSPTGSSGTNGLFGIGALSFSDTDIIASFTHSVNSYAQLVVQNKNSGASSSADIIVNNDRSAGTTYYGDFGINGTTFAAGGPFGDVDGTYLYSAGGTLSLGSLNANDVKIATNNTERVRVSAGGSVGIGTTNPTQTLHVQGNVRITGGLYDFNNGAGSTGQILQSVGTGISWTTFSGGSTITVSDDTSTNATRYPVFEDVTSGISTSINVSSTKLTFNPSTGTLSATQITSLSDINKKKNIRPIENAIEITKKLEGVRFDWKDTDAPSLGVIAQEVEKVLPELVVESDGVKSVSYGNIVGVLIEAIKEQQVRIEELERKLNA